MRKTLWKAAGSIQRASKKFTNVSVSVEELAQAYETFVDDFVANNDSSSETKDDAVAPAKE